MAEDVNVFLKIPVMIITCLIEKRALLQLSASVVRCVDVCKVVLEKGDIYG